MNVYFFIMQLSNIVGIYVSHHTHTQSRFEYSLRIKLYKLRELHKSLHMRFFLLKVSIYDLI